MKKLTGNTTDKGETANIKISPPQSCNNGQAFSLLTQSLDDNMFASYNIPIPMVLVWINQFYKYPRHN